MTRPVEVTAADSYRVTQPMGKGTAEMCYVPQRVCDGTRYDRKGYYCDTRRYNELVSGGRCTAESYRKSQCERGTAG